VIYAAPSYVAPVSYSYAAPAPAPVASSCTCLSKVYTQEGAVLFKDICTNESAIYSPTQSPSPEQQSSYQAQPQVQYQAQPQAYVPQYPLQR
jgi:hypothetical protein